MQYYVNKAKCPVGCSENVTHRPRKTIPGILKAQDVFVEEDGYIVLKNISKPYKQAYA